MKVRAVGWIASHMQRKLITIVLALCISVLGFMNQFNSDLFRIRGHS